MRNGTLLLVSGNTFEPEPWDTHTAQLWQEISKEFSSVHVLARSRRQTFTTASNADVHLHLIPMGPPRMLTFFVTSWLLPVYMVRIRPTHLQAQSTVYGGIAAVTWARLFRVPVMVEIHGEHYVRAGQVGARAHRWFFRPLARWAAKRATVVRSLAPEMTEAIGEVLGEEAARRTVEIPNRVDLRLFSPPKTTYAANPLLRIVSVGAINHNKNQLGLMRDLELAGISCELVLIGVGPLVEEVAARAPALRHVRVRMTGRLSHEDIFEELRASDVYVHYSLSEAVSRAVLEAMAVGLPVVVGPAGFLGGIVDDGRTGLRLPALDSRALGSALSTLQDEVERCRLGTAARRRIEENHEWDAVFRRYLDVLREMDPAD